jgi:hypothetical protein
MRGVPPHPLQRRNTRMSAAGGGLAFRRSLHFGRPGMRFGRQRRHPERPDRHAERFGMHAERLSMPAERLSMHAERLTRPLERLTRPLERLTMHRERLTRPHERLVMTVKPPGRWQKPRRRGYRPRPPLLHRVHFFQFQRPPPSSAPRPGPILPGCGNPRPSFCLQSSDFCLLSTLPPPVMDLQIGIDQ